MRVKVFTWTGKNSLQHEINEWLKDRHPSKIFWIGQSSEADVTIVTVWYWEKGEV